MRLSVASSENRFVPGSLRMAEPLELLAELTSSCNMRVRISTGTGRANCASMRSASHDRRAGDEMCMNSSPTELA
jgi:hypothetical protein